jgi:hypothetical protein
MFLVKSMSTWVSLAEKLSKKEAETKKAERKQRTKNTSPSEKSNDAIS